MAQRAPPQRAEGRSGDGSSGQAGQEVASVRKCSPVRLEGRWEGRGALESLSRGLDAPSPVGPRPLRAAHAQATGRVEPSNLTLSYHSK